MAIENLNPKRQIEFLINTSVEGFNNDTKIYRYMDFDCFLQIMDKKFYVSAKKQFSDCYDAGTKINYVMFNIYPEVLIDKVLLSPFMRGNSAQVLKSKLEKCYPCLEGCINKSEISLG